MSVFVIFDCRLKPLWMHSMLKLLIPLFQDDLHLVMRPAVWQWRLFCGTSLVLLCPNVLYCKYFEQACPCFMSAWNQLYRADRSCWQQTSEWCIFHLTALTQLIVSYSSLSFPCSSNFNPTLWSDTANSWNLWWSLCRLCPAWLAIWRMSFISGCISQNQQETPLLGYLRIYVAPTQSGCSLFQMHTATVNPTSTTSYRFSIFAHNH